MFFVFKECFVKKKIICAGDNNFLFMTKLTHFLLGSNNTMNYYIFLKNDISVMFYSLFVVVEEA